MNKLLKSYLSFTRTERMGIIGLCAVLIVLIIVRATMPLWVHPVTDQDKEKQLTAAWEKFKRDNTIPIADTMTVKKDYEDASDENRTPLPDIININTADSATLVRLKGIGPVTAGHIVEWRKKNGPFKNIGQLKETGRFNRTTFELLKKHLRTSDTAK